MSKIPKINRKEHLKKENNLSLSEKVNILLNTKKVKDIKELLNTFSEKEKLSIEELFIVIYCVINDFFTSIGGQKALRLSNNNNPKFTDDEIITINLVGQLSGQNSQSAWFKYVYKNYQDLFPQICQRPQYVKRSFRLQKITCFIQQYLVHLTGANCGKEFIIDSFPLELCNMQRLKSSSQPFEYDGASFGYCAAKKLHYYGFKCHLVTDLRGIPVFLCVTSAHMSDLRAFEFVISEMFKHKIVNSSTIYLGDKGYVGEDFRNNIEQLFDIKLVSMQRQYNKNLEEHPINTLIKKSRKLIETSINLLAKELHANETKRRSIKGLSSSLIDKVTAFNMASLLNLLLDQPLLRIKGFVY